MTVRGDVAERLSSWLGLLSLVVRNNPDGDVYDMLARPDVVHLMEIGLEHAEELVRRELFRAWPSGTSPYRASLERDISRAYGEARAQLREAAVRAFREVPREEFIPGVHQPGENPAMAAAVRRAHMVVRQASSAVHYLGFRNEMTVDVARTRWLGEALLASADAGQLKKWVCRKDAKDRPDSRVCEWCRRLDAMPAIPADQQFVSGEYAGSRRPPRIYYDLMCPPRHPRCRCRIILVRITGVQGSPALLRGKESAPAAYVTADHIRSMPEDSYQALREFHHAALHELGQVLRRHREVGRS